MASGKVLVIKGANYANVAVGTITPTPTPVVWSSVKAFLGGINISNYKNGLNFGRWMSEVAAMGASSSAQANYDKRVMITASNGKTIHIPKGKKIYLRGVSGLMLDYTTYSADHDPSLYRIIKVEGAVESTAVVTGCQGSTTSVTLTDVHPLVTGSYSNKVSSAYFTLFNGGANTYEWTNNTDSEYFLFAAKTEASTTASAVQSAVEYRVEE